MEPKLYLGDCLEVMQTLEPESVDMVLCDLPYGTTVAEWDKPLNLDLLWQQYKRVCNPNAAIVLFGVQPFSADVITSNRKWFRYELIWQKEKGVNFLFAKKQILKVHENILVFYKQQPTYNPQMTQGEPYFKKQGSCTSGSTYAIVKATSKNNAEGLRYPISILPFKRDLHTDKENHHPTAKPVPLLEWLIKTYSNQGQVILDNCMGSGSTGVAAINTGRQFIGIEKEQKYYDIAKERIEAAAAQLRLAI